jgi:hypothetical protein
MGNISEGTLNSRQRQLHKDISDSKELFQNLKDTLDDIHMIGDCTNILNLQKLEEFNKMKNIIAKMENDYNERLKTKLKEINEKIYKSY